MKLRKRRFLSCLSHLVVLPFLAIALTTIGYAQDTEDEYSFDFSAAPVSRYLWRGQRLTDGWSLQTAGTLGFKGFSFNVWGNLDLEAVNEGDTLLVSSNPEAGAGEYNGLQGKFSEVDFTAGYSHAFRDITIDVGTIIYSFPERSASLPSTVEIYGGVTFDKVPLSPSATLYVDVNETGDSGDTGLYFLAGGGHTLLTGLNKLPAIDAGFSLGFVNQGFSAYYYGATDSGLHDFNVTFSAPVSLGENWSLRPFIAFSALLGDFRDYQYRPAPDLYEGTAGSPATYADSVYGGVSFDLGF
ncbi:MAG: hypothetical protein JSU96_06945 [Acidobacteriota bacterium]|nr:MAG: hypothetical protein JSU96_06945 [Acidobacteriota bacterium]